VSTEYTEIQLDALRELANIGSSTAATALSSMLGRAVDVSVPSALALPLADAVDAAGPAGTEVTGIVLPVVGDLQAIVLLVAPSEDAVTLCGLLGLEVESEMGQSALGRSAIGRYA
jgi:chemotaxis protein CheC